MSIRLRNLDQVSSSEMATTVRNAGIAGAGGAGFPTYAKWDRLDEVDYLMVNHQESEPNYYIDKWLGREHAGELSELFDALLDSALDAVVVSAKEKAREPWMQEFEAATDPAVFHPGDLPIDFGDESGVVFAYTDDQYEYGMETVLLNLLADVVIGQDLPMDHGWIVQNTETLYNIYRTFEREEPVTSKYVHVGGNVPEHRFLEVPVGTPASAVLAAAGRPPEDLAASETLADGGPGWCFKVAEPAAEFGVTKRTNCVLVLDDPVVEENTRGNDRVDVIGAYDWDGDHETEPTESLAPESVRVPLITNPAFEGIVSPAEPVVSPGETVSEGEMVATRSSEGVSIPHHASIDGEVEAVTDTHVEIRQ